MMALFVSESKSYSLYILSMAYAIMINCNLAMAQQNDVTVADAGRLILQGGTIVDVRTGTLRPNVVIVMENDRITAITNERVPVESNDRSLDVTDQFIIPGLIDAHLHYEDFSPELLLNHGVTTALDLGNDYEWIKAQSEAIRAGWIPGPRLYYSTPHFDASPPDGSPLLKQRGHKHYIDDVKQARLATEEYIKQGVSAVKIYEKLDPDVLTAIAEVAESANIPVIGHFKDAETTVAVGGSGIEHLYALARSAQDPEAAQYVRELSARRPASLGIGPVASIDWNKLTNVIDKLVEKNVYLNPTLMIYKSVPHFKENGFLNEDFELLISDWRLRYIPLQFRIHLLKEYQEQGSWHWNDLNGEEQQLAIRQFESAQRITKMYVDRGGKIYAGPDCAAACTFGLGLHQEMELLVDSGVSTLKALQSATLHSAEVMRMQDEIGSVEENMLADLVVLKGNPLENIRNTRNISYVISRGRVLDGDYHPEFNILMPKPEPETSGHFFPSPRITWISPEALTTESSPVRLSVRGSGFIPYSLINFGGYNLATDFFSSTHIEADIPADFLQRGTHDITVENPDFAFGTADDADAEDLFHLGVRPRISNVFRIIVKPPGMPISIHPNESAHIEP
jgi:imidazolonepropionase-like amidohydrolase